MHLERGRRGRVVNNQFAGADLDAAGLEPGVLLAGKPRRDRSFDADDVLVAQLSGLGLKRRAGFGLEDDLSDPVTVSKVNEEQSAEIAPGVDPAVEHDVLPDLPGGQVTASMRSFQ